MYTLSLGFLTGTLALLLFQKLPSLVLLWVLPFLLLALWYFWRNLLVRAVCSGLIGFFYALFVAQTLIDQRISPEFEGKTLRVTGTVVEIPEKKNNDIRFYMNIEQARLLDQGNIPISYQGKTKLGWYRGAPEQFATGERWQLDVRLKRPSGFMNTGGFDYEKWLFRKGVLATGYVRKSDNNQKLADAATWKLDSIREFVHQQIKSKVDNQSAAAIISALSVDVRNDISDDQWRIFRNTGTSHLMAISGLHIGMIAGFALLPVSLIWMLFPSLYLRLPVKTAALIVGAVFATTYALLAGFTIPTQRALVMVLFALLALFLKQKIPLSNILVTALFVVLLIDPLAGLSEGFWLSFFSVSLIFYLLGQSYKSLPYKLLTMQILLSFGMIPVTAAFFGSASLISPLANLIAIPWVTLLVAPAILIAVLFLFIAPALSDYPLAVATWGIDYLLVFLNYLSNLPISVMAFSELPISLVLAAVLGVLLLAFPRGLPGRWLGLLFIAPLFLYAPEKLKQGEFSLSVLDVGQGLASVVQTQNHVLVFDTGERYSESFDMGKIVVLPYLQSQNIKQIDKLVISHLDKDHRGGAVAIMRKLPVIQLISSVPYSIDKQQAIQCKIGQKWIWDGVTFQVLSPSEDQQGYSKNDRSCVIKVSNKQHGLLLIADIEKRSEQWLLNNEQELLLSDVMLIPHHGSKSSSTEDFLHAVNPNFAIVSAGYRNRFHFPNVKVMSRYEQLGIPVMSTLEQGEVRVKFPVLGEKIDIHSKRDEGRYFWHR